MRDEKAAIALGGNDRFNTCRGKFRADGICIIALVGEKCVDAIAEHSEQRAEALHIVGLARRQDEAKRSPVSIAAGVELGGEAAARPAKTLGLLIPFFSPTAQ